MNPEQIISGGQKTHPDRCEKSADGAKDGLGWCDGRGLLPEIEGFDGRVQSWDGALPVLGPLVMGLGFHGRKSR